MALQPFRFKQFTVAHDRCTHKVGTDAVLLGSWVNVQETDRHLLDVGTGSGVIALMLAQRTTSAAQIDALEIHEQDAAQAVENVTQSPWPKKITVHKIAAQNFESRNRYDLIVSNPPFFLKSLHPPDKRRTTARHALDLTFQDLLLIVTRLMTPDGRFGVVLPYTEAQQFIVLAETSGLYPLRMTTFRARSQKSVERMLMEFSYQQSQALKSEIVLYDGDGNGWSDGYRSLTGGFYTGI